MLHGQVQQHNISCKDDKHDEQKANFMYSVGPHLIIRLETTEFPVPFSHQPPNYLLHPATHFLELPSGVRHFCIGIH
jgi:hypothetical protein